MQDIATISMADRDACPDSERWFIEEFAAANVRWGMPPASARVYGYLVLRSAPTSLDRIAQDLAMSKASAWNATRHLEQVHLLRRSGERGSKRALYSPADDYDAVLLNFSALLGRVGSLMRDAVANGTAKGIAADRLDERSNFYLAVQQVLADTIHHHVEARRTPRRDLA